MSAAQHTPNTADAKQSAGDAEEWIARARYAHGRAVTELVAALEARVVTETLAVYPNAVTLVTNTFIGEELALDCGWHMHPERVLDADGAVIAGCEPNDIDDRWDAFHDGLVEYLDQMIELNDESYAQGTPEYELDLRSRPAASGQPKLVVVDGVAYCPECSSSEFRYEYLAVQPMQANEDGLLVFDDDYPVGDVPGVVCANSSCHADLDATDVEVEWR